MKPIPPKTLKRILELAGYKVVADDSCSWILENNGHPVVISQTMKLVPLDVMQSILEPAEITGEKFDELLAEAEKPLAASASAKPSASPSHPASHLN